MEPLGLRHIALNVRDVGRSVDFYCSVLGMRVEWKPDEENVYLTSGSDNLAIHKLPEGAQPGAIQSVQSHGARCCARRFHARQRSETLYGAPITT